MLKENAAGHGGRTNESAFVLTAQIKRWAESAKELTIHREDPQPAARQQAFSEMIQLQRPMAPPYSMPLAPLAQTGGSHPASVDKLLLTTAPQLHTTYYILHTTYYISPLPVLLDDEYSVISDSEGSRLRQEARGPV